MSAAALSPFTGRPLPSNSQIAKARIAAAGLDAAVQKPAQKPSTANLSADLSRILRPQAAYRWLLPQLAAITPSYVELTLRGALAGNHVQAWELFDLMLDSWPELAASCQELLEGVQRKTLVFEPYHGEDEKPTPSAEEKMKVVSAALRNMTPDPAADENDLDGTIKDILSAWFMGQVVLEMCWEAPGDTGQLNTVSTDVGDILAPRSTYWVHPVCYSWSMEGRLGLRTELSQIRATSQTATGQSKKRSETGGSVWNTTAYQPRPTSVDEFPPNKFLIGIHKQKSGTALGGALLRVLAWWWCASNFSAEWLMNLAQLFGLPIRWANFDLNASQETIDLVCAMLEKMGSAAYGAFPTGTNLQLLEGSKNAENSPQAELLDRADRYARVAILGQTMTGSRGTTGKGGGQAFGVIEAEVKEDRIDAAGKFVCSVINKQYVPAILNVNYNDASEAPTVRFLDKEEGTLEDAQRDSQLAQAGLKIGVNFLRKKYGIPEPADDEDTIGGAAPAGDGSRTDKIPGDKSGGSAGMDPEDKLQKEEDALDSHHRCRCGAAELQGRGAATAETEKLVNNVLEDLTGVSAKWLGGVKPVFRELLAKAQDNSVSDADLVKAIEKARNEMPELFARMNTEALAKTLEHSMSAALINGAVSGAMRRSPKSKVQSPKAEEVSA